jgi:hypothetical protein
MKFELLPTDDSETAVSRMFCDISTFSGEPFDGDPRYVLSPVELPERAQDAEITDASHCAPRQLRPPVAHPRPNSPSPWWSSSRVIRSLG